MKIRTDFVTNSSSSSFVCIRIQSERLKELFEKYNFNAFSNDDEYNIVIREEDEIGTNDVDSIEGILSVLIEDLEMYCKNDLIKEINNNYDDIINNIEYADYEYSAEGWDEFEDSDEDECFFVYQSAEHLMKSFQKEDDKNKKSANTNIPNVRKNQTSSEYYSEPYEKVCFGMRRDKNKDKITDVFVANTVETLDNYAFKNCCNLKKVYLPSTLKEINGHAFEGCLELEEIIIPEGVERIYGHSFEGCKKLKTVILPSTLANIDAYTFKDCTELEEIIIPKGVKHIYGHAFEGCTKLKTIVLPDTLKEIHNNCFCNCTELEEIIIPESVEHIGKDAFLKTKNKITFSNDIFGPYAYAGDLSTKNKTDAEGFFAKQNALNKYKGEVKKEIIVPDYIYSINSSAFSRCDITEKIILPETLKMLNKKAFAKCNSLKTIFIPKNVSKIHPSAFEQCENLESIIVDKDNSYFYDEDGVVYSKENNEMVACPMKNLSKTTINQNENIVNRGYVFEGERYSVKTVEIPEGVTSIESHAFSFCDSLTNVTIPNSVTSIGSSAFYNCKLLTNITIPDSVTDIGWQAFTGCENLADCNGFVVIRDILFGYFGKEKQIKIPYGVKTIAEHAFSCCDFITSVELPDSVTNIGDNAFSGCSSLTSITLPHGVVSIPSSAFCECKKLKKFIIPDSVKYIEHKALGFTYNERSDEDVPFKGVKIQGYNNSAAHVYAYDNGFDFVSVGESKNPITDELYSYDHFVKTASEKDFEQCDIPSKKDIKTSEVEFESTITSINNIENIDSSSDIIDNIQNGEKVVVKNDFSIIVPDGFRYSFNKSKNKLSEATGGNPYLFYIYKGKCNKDANDIYDDVLYQYDFVFAFENRHEDDRITPKANANLSVNGAERDVFEVPFHDEYAAKCCVRYEDESSIIYGFVIHLYGVLYSGSVRFGNVSNESDCRKQFESILKSIQPITNNQNKKEVVEKKEVKKSSINYLNCDFEEVNVLASRQKLLTSLDYRRQEEKPKGCDIKLLSLKEIFKDNEDLAIAVNASYDFSMSNETKKHREEILQKAQEFAKIFRVLPEEFDAEYDRESEIRNGYIKHIYGWAALKSLVYTGNKYAQSMKTTLFDLSIDELVALSDFIESRGGANFKIRGNGRDTWMTAIRNQFETNCFFGDWKIARFLHDFDKRFWDDKQIPLKDLINNLYDLIPVMEKIKNYIAEDKSRLNSAIAEILIAWCTFSIACKEQFYIAKGDKKYSLQQVDDNFVEMPKTADLVNREDNGVVTYKNYAVAYEGKSESAIIPEGIEYFIASKFEDLTELILPSSLKVVNSNCGFNQFCREVEKMVFSEGTETLGQYVFVDFSFFSKTKEIVLPKSIESIQDRLLVDVVFKVRYDSYALEYCKKNGLKYEIVYTPEELREKENNETYSIALKEYNQCTIASLNKAIELFDKLNGFKDSTEMSKKAQDKIDLIKKQEEERRLEQERRLEEERRLAEARRLEEERILAERKAVKQSLVTERNSLSVVIEQNKHALFGEKAKLKKEAKARILEIDIELAKYSDLD